MAFKRGTAVCYGLAVCDVLIPGIPRDAFNKETTRIPRFSYNTGGDAINEAITLVKLGHRARLMSLVGRDLFGDFVLRQGEKAGVDMTGVARDPELPTTVSLVCIHPDGERSFIINRGADNALSGDCIDWSALEDADAISVGSAFSCPGLTRALPGLLQTARKREVITCVDVIRGAEEATRDTMETFLPYTDYLFPNYEEGCSFTGETELPRMARVFTEMGAGHVVIKTGKDGCHLFDKTGRHTHVPGFQVDDLKDTTGAGDNFAAGYIAGLMEGKAPEDCARFANAVAACSVRYVGASGLTGRAEVEALLAR
ncbi:MAG: sugar kinase [Eubacteriales bacterium]|nr:sugar kinase [Eubacteriales bacterium]MDD4285978.1 sugar kinase [Eubacteriales bacterium]HPF18401.1 sugar kinase [Bacillota bacterium]